MPPLRRSTLAAAVVAALVAALVASPAHAAAAAATAADCVSSNAPVLRWATRVDPSGVFAYRVDLWRADVAGAPASTGWIYATNEPFPGLHVLDGASGQLPELVAGAVYNYSVSELQWASAPGKPPAPFPPPEWLAANGSFCTSAALPSARDEARAQLGGANISTLFRNSLASVAGRVQPSGFVPTSVSGGYGGPTNMFVRDTCAMMFGLLEARAGCADADGCLSTVRKVLNFTLAAIEAAGLDYAPHVLIGDETLTRIVAFDVADQTDGTMHLVLLFSAFWRASGDQAFAARFFTLVARLLDHYVAPGATLPHPGAPPYMNTTSGLLLNPNLEHSRDGVYWTSYDVLTNTFAAEALRGAAAVAAALGEPAKAAAWLGVRDRVLAGVATTLRGPESANETRGAAVYGELIGEPHFWWPGSQNDWPPGSQTWSWPPADLTLGMSFVQQAVVGAFSAVVGSAGDDPAAAGLDVERLANTFDAMRRLGSFLWLTDDDAFSALVPLTHVNATTHSDGDRAVITKGLGWELAYAAFAGDARRLLTLARWIGFAAGNFNLTLPAESYEYDCMRLHQTNCYGDPGNGEQAGWLLFGAARALKFVADSD